MKIEPIKPVYKIVDKKQKGNKKIVNSKKKQDKSSFEDILHEKYKNMKGR